MPKNLSQFVNDLPQTALNQTAGPFIPTLPPGPSKLSQFTNDLPQGATNLSQFVDDLPLNQTAGPFIPTLPPGPSKLSQFLNDLLLAQTAGPFIPTCALSAFKNDLVMPTNLSAFLNDLQVAQTAGPFIPTQKEKHLALPFIPTCPLSAFQNDLPAVPTRLSQLTADVGTNYMALPFVPTRPLQQIVGPFIPTQPFKQTAGPFIPTCALSAFQNDLPPALLTQSASPFVPTQPYQQTAGPFVPTQPYQQTAGPFVPTQVTKHFAVPFLPSCSLSAFNNDLPPALTGQTAGPFVPTEVTKHLALPFFPSCSLSAFKNDLPAALTGQTAGPFVPTQPTPALQQVATPFVPTQPAWPIKETAGPFIPTCALSAFKNDLPAVSQTQAAGPFVPSFALSAFTNDLTGVPGSFNIPGSLTVGGNSVVSGPAGTVSPFIPTIQGMTTVISPSAQMTAANSQGCIATASQTSVASQQPFNGCGPLPITGGTSGIPAGYNSYCSAGSYYSTVDGSYSGPTTTANCANGDWLQIQLPGPQPLGSYTLANTTGNQPLSVSAGGNAKAFTPNAWQICGSNDGVVFKVLDSRSGDTTLGLPNTGTQVTYGTSYSLAHPTPVAYAYYRMIVTATNLSQTWSVSGMTFCNQITAPTPLAQVNGDWNATSGPSQIFNQPMIPTQIDYNATYGINSIINKPTISTVGKTGNYSDLISKPIILHGVAAAGSVPAQGSSNTLAVTFTPAFASIPFFIVGLNGTTSVSCSVATAGITTTTGSFVIYNSSTSAQQCTITWFACL